MFAFYLTSKEDEKKNQLSDLTFGYYDQTKFTGNIQWHNILFKYMFGVRLDDIKVNGTKLNIC